MSKNKESQGMRRKKKKKAADCTKAREQGIDAWMLAETDTCWMLEQRMKHQPPIIWEQTS